VIPPDAIAPGVPEHPIVLPPAPPEIWPSPGYPAHPIVIPPVDPANSFTVAVRNNATGETKMMTFVPGDVPPAVPGAGPKTN
jgi:hypothetical protein